MHTSHETPSELTAGAAGKSAADAEIHRDRSDATIARQGRLRVPPALEEGLAVACMALLVVITLLNVVTRYLTDESFAWTEEISVFLMVVMTMAGASAAAARDRHIRIEVLYETGSVERRRRLRIASGCATALLFLGLAVLLGRMVFDEIRWGETSMGLGVPRWWYTVLLPPLCLATALRALSLAWAAAATKDGS